MRSNIFTYIAVLVGAVLALAGPSAATDDKKDDKGKPALSGTWAIKGGEAKIEFVDKDVLKISPHGDGAGFVVLFKYSVDKDGLVKAKFTELQAKDEVKDKVKGVLPVGLEFTFLWKAEDDTAKLDDVKGENTERLKSHLEGEYEKK